MKRAALLVGAWLCIAQANAASQFGVEVYPAAKADAAVAKSLNKHMNMNIKNVATYRTSDSVSKVAEFYKKKKPLKEQPGTSKEGAMFTGKGVTVTIQNPWMDMDSGNIMKDTLISIVKN